jgi:hypothetical protein
VEQQANCIVGPLYSFNYLTNTEGFPDLNHLSSAQQNTQITTNVHSCLQLKLFEKQTKKVVLHLDAERRNFTSKMNK